MAEKRIFARVLLFSLVVAVLFANYALAQEDFDDFEEEILEGEEEVLVEDRAGITPDSPLYVFDKVVDEVQLMTSNGEEKARKALAIKGERLAEAAVMVNSSKAGSAKDALLLAAEAARVAQAEIAPDLEKETNDNVRKAAMLLTSIKNRLPSEGWEDIEAALETQLDEEEKTRIALIVSKSRLGYCDSLAKQDIELMKSDPNCDIKKAPDWLKGKVEGEFKQRDEKSRRQIIDVVSMCVLDPKQCDCSRIPVAKHVESCELNKALAIRCDYENDAGACDKLDEADDEFFDLLGEEGAKTVRELLKKKEGDFFEEMRPPECAAAATFEECFDIMTGLYGMPPFCKGISEDECMEMIKENPELVEEGMPPECKDAGVTSPRECARLMMHKYGSPPECVGMDAEACIDLMMKKGPEHVGGPGKGMPPECEGIREPRECFDIMNKKYGMPPFCKDMSEDECFEEIMKKEGPGGPEGHGKMPPECEEAGATEPRECFDIMNRKYGPPRFCEGMTDDDCFEETMRRGPEEPETGGGPEYMPPECEAAGKTSDRECTRLIMELYGLPMDICPDMSIGECVEVMINREREPGGKTLELCIGISPEECRKKMREQHGPPMECEGLNQEECVELMHQRGGMPGGTPLECAGLGPEECELVMVKKFGPPECKGMTWEECEPVKQQLFGPPECRGMDKEACDKLMGEQQGDFNREFEGEQGSVIDVCEGLSRGECEQRMMERFAPRECEGLSATECNELMERRDVPSGCEGLSPDECSRLMSERMAPEQRFQSGVMLDGTGDFLGEVERAPQGTPEERSGFPAPSSLPRESYEPMQQAPGEMMEQEGEFDSGFNEPVPQEVSSEFSEPQPEPEPRHEGEISGGEVLNGITGSIVKIAEWLKK